VGADMARPEEAEATTTQACHCAHQGVELQPRVVSDCDAQVTGASPNATEPVQEARAKKPKRCNGLPGICEHGRQRSRCKECDGSGVCEHRRLRHYCKQCGGSGICEHGRRKSDCKLCRGGSICEHDRQKRQCRECLAVYGACVHGKARNRYCRQCGDKPFPSQSARARPTFFASAGGKAVSALQVCDAMAAAAPQATLNQLLPACKIAHDISAAISAPHSGDVAQLSAILQRNIALPMYGLPQTALVSMNPLLMMPVLPAHLALQGQQSCNLDMSLLMAQANHASFVQQLNLQRARHLLQQRSFDNLNALTSGPPVGQAFDQLMGVPLGPLQQLTNASRRDANVFPSCPW